MVDLIQDSFVSVLRSALHAADGPIRCQQWLTNQTCRLPCPKKSTVLDRLIFSSTSPTVRRSMTRSRQLVSRLLTPIETLCRPHSHQAVIARPAGLRTNSISSSTSHFTVRHRVHDVASARPFSQSCRAKAPKTMEQIRSRNKLGVKILEISPKQALFRGV